MENNLKLLLSLMMLIAGVFLAQSTFAMNAEVQESLIPDTFTSAVYAPVLAFDYTYDKSIVVTPIIQEESHLNSYIINKKYGQRTSLLEIGRNFKGVETVQKFSNRKS